MGIKRTMLFGVLAATTLVGVAFLYTSISNSKDTKPVVTYEQLDNKLKTIKSDNASGSLKLEEKQKQLAEIEAQRAALEEKLK